MLLSNPKIEYSSVHRMPSVKLSGQTLGTTTNTMPTSTSLQDISSHHTQKFTWNDNNNNDKDQRLVSVSDNLLPSNTGRQLSTSQSDERIFQHPEVTIIPSVLGDEMQRRLLTMKTSNTSDSLLEHGGKSAPNILEHPDMRSPVVMQPQQISISPSSTALSIQNDCKRVGRTHSADAYSTTARTPSPGNLVNFFIDNQQNSKRSASPGSFIGDITENPEQGKNEDHRSTTTSNRQYPQPSSNAIINPIKTKKNDSW